MTSHVWPSKGTYSRLRIYDGNGHGTDSLIKIRRFVSVTEAVGFPLSYTDSATEGAMVSALADCMARGSYSDQYGSGSAYIDISLNAKGSGDPNGSGSSHLTTAVELLSHDMRLMLTSTSTLPDFGNVAVGVQLNKGDVIRPHTNGNPNTGLEYAQFLVQGFAI